MVNRLLLALLLFGLGCQVDVENYGLGLTQSTGPQIIFNPLTKPFAEIPMPNDLALVRNANTATGLSWNASIIRPSTHGSKLREHLNEMDGFGTFGPSMIQFDRPILIETVNDTSV
ncbi:MAG: hypothetical protein ACPGQS_13705, partial [Bradymonadia bacterium]